MPTKAAVKKLHHIVPKVEKRQATPEAEACNVEVNNVYRQKTFSEPSDLEPSLLQAPASRKFPSTEKS